MHQIAAILDFAVLYRYSMILALAVGAGICFFMACCVSEGISERRAAATVLAAVILSLLLARLVYWYGRPDRFSSLVQALTAPATEDLALAGAFGGCFLAAMLLGGHGGRKTMLDCMSVSGCVAIALGRLASFFADTDRGQIMAHLTKLPWAYPVKNVSGQLEYRFATFLFQAAVAAVLLIFLAAVFLRKKHRPGDVTVLFLLAYSASQVILDSTRYDSLYLRSNGFVSLVQIFSAVALAYVVIYLCIRAVKAVGWKPWMIFVWLSLAALFGAAGCMEYYVQRRGREAAFSYSVMGACLAAVVAIGCFLLFYARRAEKE